MNPLEIFSKNSVFVVFVFAALVLFSSDTSDPRTAGILFLDRGGAFLFTLGPLEGVSRPFQAMALVLMCSHDFSQFIDWAGMGIYI